jgi:hypothetical protein
MAIKDYDLTLFNILKPLVDREDPVKLYHNVIDEDFNDHPQDYVVYSTEISNTPRVYGDGKVLLRRCSCDVTVVELGTGNNTQSGYLFRQVEQLLIDNNIRYTKVNLGYDESTDSMQTTFDFYIY